MDKVVAKLDESICDDRDSSLIASNGSAIRRNDSWRVSLLDGPFLTRLALSVEFLLQRPPYDGIFIVDTFTRGDFIGGATV